MESSLDSQESDSTQTKFQTGVSGDDDEDGEGGDTWRPGNFECEYCTKMFMATGGLLKHVQQVKDCREFYGEGRIREAIQCCREILRHCHENSQQWPSWHLNTF